MTCAYLLFSERALPCLQENVHLNSLQCKLNIKEGERRRQLNLQSHVTHIYPAKKSPVITSQSQHSTRTHPVRHVRLSYERSF